MAFPVERHTLYCMGEQRRNALFPAATCVVLTLLGAGCSSPAMPAIETASPNQLDVALCQGNKVPVQALDNPRPATELGPEAAPALSGRGVDAIRPDKWLIAQESAGRVMLMNKMAIPQDTGRGDIRDYEYIVLSTNSMSSQSEKPVWDIVESSTCAPTLDLGEKSAGLVTLDPSQPVSPESTKIAFLVTEVDCNSGQNAVGRLGLVQLTETESTVEIVIGVLPSGATSASCQGNPGTPFTVEIQQPVGTRAVLNAAVVPAREITASKSP